MQPQTPKKNQNLPVRSYDEISSPNILDQLLFPKVDKSIEIKNYNRLRNPKIKSKLKKNNFDLSYDLENHGIKKQEFKILNV